MKIIKNLLFLSLFLTIFISCQDEINEIITPDETVALNTNAKVASLVQKTVTKDGSKDNIIDKASCMSVELPVTVSVNGLEIIIDSEQDFEIIEEIFDEFDDDIDKLEIFFPIVVTLSDYSTITINSYEEMEAIIDDCENDNEIDDDIECVDFVYPINLSIYDSKKQITETKTINSDEEFYYFMDDLDDYYIVEINFPISVVLWDGTKKSINNMDELEMVIEQADDMCDEDDDNDYDDDDCVDCTVEKTTEILMTCKWDIDKLVVNEINNTEQYIGYQLWFRENGEVKAIVNNQYIYGTWAVELSENNKIIVSINFEDLPDFSYSWILYEIEEEEGEVEVDLRLEDGAYKLELEQQCEDNSNNISELEELLMTCKWEINKLLINQDDVTEQYVDYLLWFREQGEVKAIVNNEYVYGTWVIDESVNDEILVKINFEDLHDLSFEWILYEIGEGSEGQVEVDLRIEDGAYKLKLDQQCEDTSNNDKVALLETLKEGTWKVAKFQNEDVIQTENYNGWSINFMEEKGLLATKGDDQIHGVWEVYYDGDQLKVDFDFSTNIPFNEFNEDWKVIEFKETRVELKYISDTNKISILVFERN